ncbi:hypothetical protein [Rhizobium phaseoli]|uniref:hypothetical protein n=1 Tax=Rhizobium phaseoli TaxID=396 RepID=UPI000AD4F4F8|nr:hypothetical protein [Rhizobium phaseoli]
MAKILRDEDLVGGALMPIAIDALEAAFLARAGNRLTSSSARPRAKRPSSNSGN